MIIYMKKLKILIVLISVILFINFDRNNKEQQQNKNKKRRLQGTSTSTSTTTKSNSSNSTQVIKKASCKLNVQMDVSISGLTKSMDYIQGYGIVTTLLGKNYRLDLILNGLNYNQYFMSFDILFGLIITGGVLNLIMIIGMFLYLNPHFPSLKYRRNLDIDPYNLIERNMPPLNTLMVSVMLIILGSYGIIKIKELEYQYQLSVCSALATSHQFLSGYSTAQAKQYARNYTGLIATINTTQIIQKMFMQSNMTLSLQQSFIYPSIFLNLYIYNVQNSIQVIYSQGYNTLIQSPDLRYNEQQVVDKWGDIPKVMPDLITYLGDVNRQNTYTYNITQEFSNIYLYYQIWIDKITYQSTYLGQNAILISQKIVQQKLVDLNFTMFAYLDQLQRLNDFILDADLVQFQMKEMLSTVFITIILLSCLAILFVYLSYGCELKRLAYILHFVWFFTSLLMFLSLACILFTSILTYSSLEFCQHIDNIKYNNLTYNNSYFFYNSSLRDKFFSCFYSDGDLNSTQQFQDLRQNISTVDFQFNKIKETPFVNQSQMVYQQYSNAYNLITTDPAQINSNLQNNILQNPVLMMKYLNSMTDYNQKYNNQQLQTNSQCVQQTQDQYVFNETQCIKGYDKQVFLGICKFNLFINTQKFNTIISFQVKILNKNIVQQ